MRPENAVGRWTEILAFMAKHNVTVCRNGNDESPQIAHGETARIDREALEEILSSAMAFNNIKRMLDRGSK